MFRMLFFPNIREFCIHIGLTNKRDVLEFIETTDLLMATAVQQDGTLGFLIEDRKNNSAEVHITEAIRDAKSEWDTDKLEVDLDDYN